jgi:hypothetical protein
MEKIAKNHSRRYIVFIILILSFLSITSCRVTLVPGYDANISAQIDNTAKEVDKFYLTMLETTKTDSGGRAFEKFSQDYINIEVELNSLLTKNKIRPLNENSTQICEITLQLWLKYKAEHKTDNTLSDGLIILNRKTFSDLFYAMQVAEKGKELVKNPPE